MGILIVSGLGFGSKTRVIWVGREGWRWIVGDEVVDRMRDVADRN